MKAVIADTSPINYLVLIDCVDLLRRLYGRILIPDQVFHELTATGAPAIVSAWIRTRPDWVEIRSVDPGAPPPFANADDLDDGELAAIQLALAEGDSLLLIDESAGRKVASRLGIPNTGTLGVLLGSAQEGHVDLEEALSRLRSTNFRISAVLIAELLTRARGI